jgi:hypothetical protein
MREVWRTWHGTFTYLEIEEGLGKIQRRNKLRGLENTDGTVVSSKKVERNFYVTEV